MINLLEETLDALNSQNKSSIDVMHVQWNTSYCTWKQFASAAADLKYDSGYGGQEVEPSLKIVGDDWWLERGEYDGSEWWEFKTMPTIPDHHYVPLPDDLKYDWARSK